MSQQDRSFASRVSMEVSHCAARPSFSRRWSGEKCTLADAARSSVLTVCCHRCPGCLRLLADNEALLIAGYEGVSCGEQAKSSMETLFFRHAAGAFLSAEREGVMSASLRNQQGLVCRR